MSEPSNPIPRDKVHPDRIRQFVYISAPRPEPWNAIMTGEEVAKQGWGIDKSLIILNREYRIILKVEGSVSLDVKYTGSNYDVIFVGCHLEGVKFKLGHFRVIFIDSYVNNCVMAETGSISGLTFWKCTCNQLSIIQCNSEHVRISHSNISQVLIDDTDISYVDVLQSICPSLIFKNCRNVDRFTVASSFLPNVHLLSGTSINKVQYDDRAFTGSFICKEASVTEFSLRFRVVVNSIQVTKGIIGILEASENVLFESVQIVDSSKVDRLCFSKHVVCGVIKVEQSRLIRCLLGSEVICNTLSMVEFEMVKTIQCQPLSRVGSFHLSNGKVERMLVKKAHTSFSFSNIEIQLFKLENSEVGGFLWNSGNKGEYYISDSSINMLDFANTSVGKETLVNMGDTTVNCIDFTQSAVNGQLIFRNLIAGNITDFRSFTISDGSLENYDACYQHWKNAVVLKGTDYTRIVLRKLEQSFSSYNDFLNLRTRLLPTIILVNASMGKTEITGSNLDEFQIRYRNSRLLDLYVPGSEINLHDIQIDTSTESDNLFPESSDMQREKLSKIEKIRQKAFIHQQFKKVYDNQGDIVTSSYHHSQAMIYQSKLLRKRFWGASFFRKFPMGLEVLGYSLNMCSNKHGESWPRALLFTFAAAALFFTPYYALARGGSFSFTYASDYIKYLIQFIDLTHKYDFMVPEKNKLSAELVALDFVGRLAVGYGIFQFISAFRRHGKKSV